MTSKIHLLIPMSGQGTRYQKAGYTEPKPLIPVSGTPMIERLLQVYPQDWPTHFVLAHNHLATHLPGYLRSLRPDARIEAVDVHAKGPGWALLKGLDQIPDDAPVLVSYCDFGMVWDARQFERFVSSSECDACLISYRGFHAHYLNPVTYAYSRMQGQQVVEVKEKGSFTSNREDEYASAGAYYFRSARLLRKALQYQIDHKLELNGELYTSLTVEALLQANPQSDVRVFEIPFFYQWGTPEDLQVFEYWEKTYSNLNREQKNKKSVGQILMPMAGKGSRFETLTHTPKPMISIDGKPMYQRALETLPQADKTALVCLDSVASRLEGEWDVVSLKETPEGQALSTKAGLSALDSIKDVLVSACDHGVVLDHEVWARFKQDPMCDAAIFTIKGYPGTLRRPQAFAYVLTSKEDGVEFAKVQRISVKQPLTEQPQQDALLVGTFWFRSQEVLAKGIELLEARNNRVNGELYLDSIFELLLEQGAIVREVPLSGYINWGDPDAYAEALYWQENFCGQNLEPRKRTRGLRN